MCSCIHYLLFLCILAWLYYSIPLMMLSLNQLDNQNLHIHIKKYTRESNKQTWLYIEQQCFYTSYQNAVTCNTLFEKKINLKYYLSNKYILISLILFSSTFIVNFIYPNIFLNYFNGNLHTKHLRHIPYKV